MATERRKNILIKMKKIRAYIAISIDGKIAKPNGDVSWLDAIPNPDQSDYNYFSFLDSITTTLMGYNTYKHILELTEEFPYPTKKNYVLSSKNLENTEHVTFISSIEDIQKVKETADGDIWLIGGGVINALCLENNLVDEIELSIMPIVLGQGIPLFGDNTLFAKQFELTNCSTFKSGVVQLSYKKVV